jgi:type IV pilus assembly protein PilA
MKQLQQGFTLIELMIVVAIIGILAALAVPAYQDYTIRSKVSEAASLASAAKTAVDVYYSENGTLSTTMNNAKLGLSSSVSYAGKYVEKVSVGSKGVVTVKLRNITELGDAGTSGKDTVVYTPVSNGGGNLRWTNSTSTVPSKYLPRT